MQVWGSDDESCAIDVFDVDAVNDEVTLNVYAWV